MRPTRYAAPLITGLAVMALAGAAAAGTVSYDPSQGTLPQMQGWTKAEGGPVQPTPTVSGGVMHQGPTDVGGFQYWQYTDAAFNFASTVVTVDLRLHIDASSFDAYPRGGYTVFLSDSAGRFASLYLSSGSVFLGNDTASSVSSIVPFDTTDGFHDYQFVIGPTGSSLSIDGTSIVSLALGAVSFSANSIAFGDGTTLANSESELMSFSVSGVTLTEIPEPGSLAVLGVGLGALRLRRAARLGRAA